MKTLKAFLLTMLVLACAVLVVIGCANLPVPAADASAVQDVAGMDYLAGEIQTYEEVTGNEPAAMLEENVTKSDETVTVDLRGYCVIYDSGNDISLALRDKLVERISDLTGEVVDTTGRYSGNFDKGPVSTTSNGRLKRIVLTTEDIYAEKAYEGYEGKDFVIRVFSQQLVITGKNSACCALALEYFMENYLKDSYEITMPRVITGMLNGGNLTIGQRGTKTVTTSGDTSTTTYAAGTATPWRVVFDNDLDHDGTWPDSKPTTQYGSGGTGNDGLYDKAANLVNWLNVRVAGGGSTYTLTDDTTTNPITNEILIGQTGRDESALALQMIDETQIIVAVFGNEIDGYKIVATGHTLEAQLAAADVLQKMLIEGGFFMYHPDQGKTYSKSGNVATTIYPHPITVPDNLCLIAKYDSGLVRAKDAVLPGLTTDIVMDVNNGDMMYVYYQESKSAYDTYCAALVSAGYVLVNEGNPVDDSYFRTYANYKTGILIQADFNSFSRTGEALGSPTYTQSDTLVEEVFTYVKDTIRVTVSNLLTGYLPDAARLSPNQKYTKVCDSKIVSINLGDDGGDYGTGYVMLLEDGRFVVVDGTSSGEGFTNFWSIVTTLHEQVNGTLTTDNPIEIAAWIITHNHGDHNSLLNTFSHYADKNYRCGKNSDPNRCTYCYPQGSESNPYRGLATLQYCIINYPSVSEIDNLAEPGHVAAYSSQCRFTNCEVVKPVTGQTLYLANLKIETLFTHKDVFPQRLVAMNDTSTIQRLNFVATTSAKNSEVELDHTNIGDAKNFSFVSTGDLYIHGGRWMAAMYGTTLASDMISMAHHGNHACEAAFYDLVNPTIVWWSMAKTTVHGSYLKGSNWANKVAQHVYDDIDWSYLFIADDYNLAVTLTATTNLANLRTGNYASRAPAIGTNYGPTWSKYSSSGNSGAVAIYK